MPGSASNSTAPLPFAFDTHDTPPAWRPRRRLRVDDPIPRDALQLMTIPVDTPNRISHHEHDPPTVRGPGWREGVGSACPEEANPASVRCTLGQPYEHDAALQHLRHADWLKQWPNGSA
jgi:hypothetical protein